MPRRRPTKEPPLDSGSDYDPEEDVPTPDSADKQPDDDNDDDDDEEDDDDDFFAGGQGPWELLGTLERQQPGGNVEPFDVMRQRQREGAQGGRGRGTGGGRVSAWGWGGGCVWGRGGTPEGCGVRKRNAATPSANASNPSLTV